MSARISKDPRVNHELSVEEKVKRYMATRDGALNDHESPSQIAGRVSASLRREIAGVFSDGKKRKRAKAR